jgi:hypothetical protein
MIRREKTDPNAPTTFFELARAGLELEAGSGRHSATAQVVGSDAAPYPAQPAGSPWASDPVPVEPPLGESVEDMVPTGTPTEVAASIERAECSGDA